MLTKSGSLIIKKSTCSGVNLLQVVGKQMQCNAEVIQNLLHLTIENSRSGIKNYLYRVDGTTAMKITAEECVTSTVQLILEFVCLQLRSWPNLFRTSTFTFGQFAPMSLTQYFMSLATATYSG